MAEEETTSLGDKVIAIPGYLDAEAWAAFCEMRKTIKKPLTTYAAKLILYELQRIKDAGHSPNDSLKQSIINCWKDVFAPKVKTIEKASGGQAEETARWLDTQRQTPEQRKASEEARRTAMGRRIH